jgi:hypothetical protein
MRASFSPLDWDVFSLAGIFGLARYGASRLPNARETLNATF